MYFFLFRFLILRRNYATPGREEGEEDVKLYTRADYNQKKNAQTRKDDHGISKLILEGLGGRENIVTLDCCATRLRVTVKNEDLVSENILKASGARGVILRGGGVQVVYGPQVSVIKSVREDYMTLNIE